MSIYFEGIDSFTNLETKHNKSIFQAISAHKKSDVDTKTLYDDYFEINQHLFINLKSIISIYKNKSSG